MLHSKRSVKLIAIISAVCLLLAGVVTGTVFALSSRDVLAVDELTTGQSMDQQQYKFTIESPSGVTLWLNQTYTLDSILDVGGGRGWTAAQNQKISALKRESGKFTIALSDVSSMWDNGFALYYTITEAAKGVKFGYQTERGFVTDDSANNGNWIEQTQQNVDNAVPAQLLIGIHTTKWAEGVEIKAQIPKAQRKIDLSNSSLYTFTQVSGPEQKDGQAAASFTVEDGSAFYFTLAAKDPSMVIANVTVLNETVTPNENGVYTIPAVHEDITISATRGYEVKEAGTNVKEGYITSITAKPIVASNADYSFTVTPTTGYTIEQVSATMGGAPISELHGTGSPQTGYSYTIYAVSGKVEVTIKATPATYDVTVGSLGEATYASENTPTYNTEFVFTVTPNPGYEVTVSYKIGNGQFKSATSKGGNSYAVPAAEVTGNITISATTTPKQYKVTYTNTDQLTVTPRQESDSPKATVGSEFNFTATPVSGWRLTAIHATIGTANLTVSGPLVSEGLGSYGITLTSDKLKDNVAEEITIKFVTEAIQRTVTFTGAHFTAPTTLTATRAADYKFTLTLDPGYELAAETPVQYSVEGVEGTTPLSDSEGTYTIIKDKITNNLTITVSTVAKNYMVTTKINGTDYSAGKSPITFSSNQQPTIEGYTFTVDPVVSEEKHEKYQIGDVIAKCGETRLILNVSLNQYTIPANQITGDVTIEVTATEVMSELSYTTPDGFTYQEVKVNGTGSSMLTSSISVSYRSTVTFKLEAIEGYSLRDVKVTYNGQPFEAKGDAKEKGFYYEADERGVKTYTIEKVNDNNKDTVAVTNVKPVQTVSNASNNDAGYVLKVRVDGVDEEAKELKKGESITVLNGEVVYITVTHETGFGFTTLSVNGVDIRSEVAVGVEYSLGEVEGNKLIRVVTAENTYTINYHDAIEFKDSPDNLNTVKLTYTNFAVDGGDTYTLPVDNYNYYDRQWKTEEGSGIVKTELKKSEIADTSRTLDVYAVWTWNNNTDSINTLLKLVVTTYESEDRSAKTSRVNFAFDIAAREDWKKFALELKNQNDKIEVLGFIYTADQQFTKQNNAETSFGEIINAMLADAKPEGWKKSVQGSTVCWYALEKTGPDAHTLPAFSQINAWNWVDENTRYGWTFSEMKATSFSQRRVKGWVSLMIDGARKVLEENTLTIVSEYATKPAAEAALLPEAPSMEDESYEEPTIE